MIVGKTNTPEFGTVAFTESDLNGATRNPWDTGAHARRLERRRGCGVSAGLVPLAHATDGGGSIRIPASCCGLFGLKPSQRPRVERAVRLAGRTLHRRPDGANRRGCAAFLDVLAGYEPGDPWWAPPPERPFAATTPEPPAPLRIAVATTPPIDTPVDPECDAGHGGCRGTARRGSATRSRGDAAVDRAGLFELVHRGLAGRPRAPPGRRVVADIAQSRPGRVGPGHLGGRLRPRGRTTAGVRPEARLILERDRRPAHPDARTPTRADRLAGGASTGRWSSCGATRSSRRSPPSPTSPGSRRCRSRCTGARPASRSASRSSARPRATRSCSASRPRSRPRVRGQTAGRPVS